MKPELPRILVTGALGYIGSHICTGFLRRGAQVLALDDLSGTDAAMTGVIAKAAGAAPQLCVANLRDGAGLRDIVAKFTPGLVVHCAAEKSIHRAATAPLMAYQQNITALLNLLQTMQVLRKPRMVFLSSAAVYGICPAGAVPERAPLIATSVYGRSKVMGEQILRDWTASDPEAGTIALRLFNVAGIAPDLWPGIRIWRERTDLISNVLRGLDSAERRMTVYGSDLPTADGSAERDFVDVRDVVHAVLAAERYLRDRTGFLAVNIASGQGRSVLDVIGSFERVAGRNLTLDRRPPRDGEVNQIIGITDRARAVLGWQPTRAFNETCASAWAAWQQARNGGADQSSPDTLVNGSPGRCLA